MAQESGDKVVWFLAGAAIGAAIALLYAPASGEETRRFGRGAFRLQDVAVFIAIHEFAEEGAVRHVADGDEDALELEFTLLLGEQVLEFRGAHLALLVGEVFRDGAVPDGLDLRIGQRAVGHDF